MRSKTHNRYIASAVHLSLSIMVFSLVFFILLYFWYPAPFFSASGGWQGLRIVAFIDIVLGPLLTLVVFNSKKSKNELTCDIVTITILQTLALCWGVYTIHQQRPVVVAFLDNEFYTVTARDLKDAKFDLQRLKTFGTSNPLYVYIKKPSTTQGLLEFQKTLLNKRISPIFNMDYYTPINDHLEEIFNHSLDFDQIITKNNSMKDKFFSLVPKADDPILALRKFKYIGLVSRYRNIVVVFNEAGNIIGHASAPFKR